MLTLYKILRNKSFISFIYKGITLINSLNIEVTLFCDCLNILIKKNSNDIHI